MSSGGSTNFLANAVGQDSGRVSFSSTLSRRHKKGAITVKM